MDGLDWSGAGKLSSFKSQTTALDFSHSNDSFQMASIFQ